MFKFIFGNLFPDFQATGLASAAVGPPNEYPAWPNTARASNMNESKARRGIAWELPYWSYPVDRRHVHIKQLLASFNSEDALNQYRHLVYTQQHTINTFHCQSYYLTQYHYKMSAPRKTDTPRPSVSPERPQSRASSSAESFSSRASSVNSKDPNVTVRKLGSKREFAVKNGKNCK